MEEQIAMNGGDGPNSYTQNSKFQSEVSTRAKVLLTDSIQENLIIQSNSNHDDSVFRIADLGCSVGPNTFSCIETMVETVKLKFDLESKNLPEFQVFFNDHVANDFNTLFNALPVDRKYMATGVPGSFHGRLFPKASMNLMHCAFALHWLSKVPEEITQKDSPCWNKGITYVGSSNDVVKAYTSQFLGDVKAFLKARTTELADDGLLVILMPCRPEGTIPSESIVMQVLNCLGYALTDMAKEDLIDEDRVDSFNLPIYMPTPSEVKQVISSFECLSIQKMELTYQPTMLSTQKEVEIGSLHIRAVMEGIISKHFGSEIVDQLFKRCTQKLEEFGKTPNFVRTKKTDSLFLLVKRNAILSK